MENTLYFNSTRINTLSILNAFNNIKVNDKVVPITFSNYEKSIALEDIDQDTLEQGNWNFIPRMSLSFDSLESATSRATNKFQKISKKIHVKDKKIILNMAYNSRPYDFNYTLNVQARGLNEAFQIVEQILPKFRPSMHIAIKEYPLFDEMTETQLLITDPEFDIMDEFGPEDVNIVNVTFGLTLRGNLYMPIQLVGAIEVVKIFNHLWDNQNYNDSQLASEYHYDVCIKDGKIYNELLDMQYAPAKLSIKTVKEIEETTACNKDDINIRDTRIDSEKYYDLLTESEYYIVTESEFI